jgi:hypothetical protein
MESFPEMPKRSIELPLGCKDLPDVEARRSWTSHREGTRPKIWGDQLACCEGFLAGLLHQAGGTVLVGISVFQRRGQVHLLPDPTLATPVVFAS